MMRIKTACAVVTVGLLVASGGFAASRRMPAADPNRPSALDPVVACRALPDPTARLACFDRTVDALQAAASRHDVVVVDRAEVAKARRSLFGFDLPTLRIFGGGENASPVAAEDREISSTVRSAHRDADSNWVITLEDGAVWHQMTGTLAVAPRAGDAVVIRRAALSSYFLRVGRQPGVKARRES